jgi:hypothetical protein
MKTPVLLGFIALLSVRLCYAAEAGVVTVLDGSARLLRGATWYKLDEGARVQDGDVIEAAERAQVQLEGSAGDVLNAVGPASLFVAGAAPREGKQPAAAEFYLPQGWLKLAAKPPGAPLRLRTPLGLLEGGTMIAVARAAANTLEVFVESGTARVSESGRSGEAIEVRGGDFIGRSTDRPFAVTGAAPQAFVAALPRHLMSSLPARAERFRTTRVELAIDHPISYAEAEPWLAGPYRRVFIKRLQPRLADPAFRAAVLASAQSYPEWSAVLAPAASSPEPEKTPQQAKAKEPEKGALQAKAKEPDKSVEQAKAKEPEKPEKPAPWWWPFGRK